jgi:hypothetical protein
VIAHNVRCTLCFWIHRKGPQTTPD